MGLFSRKPTTLLPKDLGHHLLVYGENEFKRRPLSASSIESYMALGRMQFLSQDDEIVAARLVDEVTAAATSTGGFALFGAFAAVHAFVPSRLDSPEARELLDLRVRFLRAEQPPGWRENLSVLDKVRLRELFPGEL